MQPVCRSDQQGRQYEAADHPDLGTQDAGLGRQHEKQDDADECHRDTRNGKQFADPPRGAHGDFRFGDYLSW
ncbi:hypothetical protein MMIN_07580 [Mycolicibacter minnesotensis]|nr:hypothetical protein MMIN_07580 [Mycolicibacter minnesotensis]